MEELMIFTVYEVSAHLRQVIESNIEELYVQGEVSNFVHHSSGHMYFNLKDDNATLRCTFFRPHNISLNFSLEDGLQVVCFGKLTLYEKGGTYNLNVKNVSLAGKGNLALQFERLKAKLQEEGLFDEAHKRPLPKYPNKIGIVTSPTGAALQDIKNILIRRFPVEVEVYPALVQGDTAAATLIKGMEYFGSQDDIDLIIITRGGGSQEDLWCFNDEALARSIHHSPHPVISAVGHEIDFTIADFVADLRAPTPSAAAELAVPDKAELMRLLEVSSQRMLSLLQAALDRSSARLSDARFQLGNSHPERRLQSMRQRVDQAHMVLQKSQDLLLHPKHKLQVMEKELYMQLSLLQERIMQHRSNLDKTLGPQLSASMRQILADKRQDVKHKKELLELQSPYNMLDRGFAYVTKADKPIDSVSQVAVDDELTISLKDGDISSKVRKIRRREESE
ncbi:MAG TPA: exodeoxyribonuclease VII large subunit [Candidatus Cloacimonetes bacterium]|nr:exodeoxyribonuclease VII large subunit [Candidatus Cloacimonadota bacterium]